MQKKNRILFSYDIILLLWTIAYIVRAKELVLVSIRLLSVFMLCISFWIFAINNLQNEQINKHKHSKLVRVVVPLSFLCKTVIFFGFIFVYDILLQDYTKTIIICGIMLSFDLMATILLELLFREKDSSIPELKRDGDKLELKVSFKAALRLYLLSVGVLVVGMAQLFFLMINNWWSFCQLLKLVLILAFIHCYVSTPHISIYLSVKRIYLALMFCLLELSLSFVFSGSRHSQYILVPVCIVSIIIFEICVCTHIGKVVHIYLDQKNRKM